MKMKFQILVITLVIICGQTALLSGQSLSADKLPTAVADAFKSRFPEAQYPKWVKSGDKEYSVFFSVNKWKHFAMFNESGNCFEDDAEMAYAETPAPIKAVVSKQYPKFIAKKTTLLKEEGKKDFYELHLVKEKESYTIRFSAEGEILRNSGKKMLK